MRNKEGTEVQTLSIFVTFQRKAQYLYFKAFEYNQITRKIPDLYGMTGKQNSKHMESQTCTISQVKIILKILN